MVESYDFSMIWQGRPPADSQQEGDDPTLNYATDVTQSRRRLEV
jgi:hypothetical protein